MPRFRCAVSALLAAAVVFAAAPAATADDARPRDASRVPTAAPDRPTRPTRINDVDGDGRLDVVFVDPGEISTTEGDGAGRPGSVQVLFGDGKLQQVTTVELHDRLFEDSAFGSGLVVGDLNRDGYADIVVSDQFALDYRGRVWALWGSAAGISAARTTVLATGEQGIDRWQPRVHSAPGTGARHWRDGLGRRLRRPVPGAERRTAGQEPPDHHRFARDRRRGLRPGGVREFPVRLG